MIQVTRRPKPPEPPIDPEEYRYKPLKKRLCTADSETDPFALDPETGKAREVKPFTIGFYDGDSYHDFWGDDCVAQFFTFLDANYAEEELMIAVHNGGNFDFFFWLSEMDENTTPFIMNGRLVRIECHGQEFRDSYTLIPVALDQYQKTAINYTKFEREVREQHKAEIRAYQKDDVIYLFELVSAAYEEFGDKLTMASVALPKLRSFHGFEEMGERVDAELRPFYFGGRTQAFEVGELRPSPGTKWQGFDINSSYPNVMQKYSHPVSAQPIYEKRITSRSFFAKITATSRGALPIRKKDGGLDFPNCRGEFFACIHEIRAAVELGLLDIHKVHFAITFKKSSNFADFVSYFYARRMEAEASGDKIRKLFWKLVLNSAYGKFAQDPRKYEQFLFDPPEHPEPAFCAECSDKREVEGEGYTPCGLCLNNQTSADGWLVHTIRGGKVIYARPQLRMRSHGFFNVATAASITSAARAELLRGLAASQRPIYCDTDSIICERFYGDCEASRLGAWKLEFEGDVAFIACKKMYAVFNEGENVKKASKGVKLTPDQIARVAAGEVIEYCHEVPKFVLGGGFKTTERTIRRDECAA